ncbi:CinA family nicotinamide mononucleotide deamidase-related protein [Vibrio aphrogenes]|uniref:CinA family nicotinamide mononucleotide deamidase-related protein n=1 Tax=Vibrio aphrogenes TaxID=1891186 RepID=UPI000B34F5A8|nr:CinA family nicotinamide mononucleotide deamidase-related protein [Vibrio aphrogenes]
MVKVSMLSTGEEVLHGDIIDTNASWLSELFFEQGFALHYRSTVGDQLEELKQEIIALSLKSDIVIVNGGLGPTSDDLSALAAAQAVGKELVLNQQWVDVMTAYFARIGRPMAASNEKQAMLPQDAEMIHNPVGTACGFSIELNDAVVFFTPGVPFEFKRMVVDEILPRMKQRYPEVDRLECNKIYTFGLGESGIADLLKDIELPVGFSLGYRSYMPFIEVKVFSRYQDSNIGSVIELISERLANFVLGVNKGLPKVVAELLESNDWQLSVIEQATGGEIARSLSLEPLAAEFFVQSIVDNQAPLITELQDSMFLVEEYRQESGADMVLGNYKMDDGTFALIVLDAQGYFAQQISFKRDYPLKAQQSLIATIGLDMLRRYVQKEDCLPPIGHFERVAYSQA